MYKSNIINQSVGGSHQSVRLSIMGGGVGGISEGGRETQSSIFQIVSSDHSVKCLIMIRSVIRTGRYLIVFYCIIANPPFVITLLIIMVLLSYPFLYFICDCVQLPVDFPSFTGGGWLVWCRLTFTDE